ncbi:C40 family peptidase [Streptacidiphilus albus]|uniref:C40 family peptidase n=1 Tax=Streptacidiphilus albus TaxID=105425 RepID=UPI00054C266A|nr:bifunctional lytic transglycosylase/C40 family peptidase [Streptacidiphilus albus]
MAAATARAAAGLAVGCGTVLTLFLAAAIAAVTAAVAVATGGLSLLLDGGAPSPQATADIPPAMLSRYRQAATTCPGLPWTILAGIGKVESDHGRARNQVSSAGAVGPMQFLPSTFTEYDQPVPPGGANPPTPWDATDAVQAAARLLCAHGGRNGKDLRNAVYQYNHDEQYVDTVMAYATRYASADSSATDAAPPGTGAARALAFARSQVGVPYQWGAEDPGHAFDCSGLTQAAYAAAGIILPRVAQDQYDHGPRLPTGTPIQPGDLVFFGTSTDSIVHVGIAVSGTTMIDAPHSGTLVRLESIGRPIGAARPSTASAGQP